MSVTFASVGVRLSSSIVGGVKRGNPEACEFSVVEHAFRRIVKVIELPVAGRLDEQRREDTAQNQGDRQKKEDRVHVSLPPIEASMRDEPQITRALDAGIRMAATSGLTKPAAAALTATIL